MRFLTITGIVASMLATAFLLHRCAKKSQEALLSRTESRYGIDDLITE